MNHDMLEKYAELVVKTGINIQKDQTLVIVSPIECAAFTRMIAQTAYEAGARDVVINWKDEQFTKIRLTLGADEIFDEYPSWQQEMYLSNVRKGAAFVSISASDPELMKDVKPDRMIRSHKASSTALAEYKDRLMGNENAWCVISIPTAAWAKKVFHGISEEQAVERLWASIFKAVRVDQMDPVSAWEQHKKELKKNIDVLNAYNLKSLHYKNALGTDLRVELPENHIWLGGSEYTAGHIEFIANMPTEEIFTLPKKTGVNGVVMSAMPFNYNGNLIDHFSLTFQEGRIIDYQAEMGYETLKQIIESDEGSHYLGEVALVPYDSPISNEKILFYNTLFDENASCHLAIGKAYSVCLKNGENKSKEELIEAGMNDSLMHEDFMIGTADLEIDGITADGSVIAIFREGNFAF